MWAAERPWRSVRKGKLRGSEKKALAPQVAACPDTAHEIRSGVMQAGVSSVGREAGRWPVRDQLKS